jgi:hypothetical protein
MEPIKPLSALLSFSIHSVPGARARFPPEVFLPSLNTNNQPQCQCQCQCNSSGRTSNIGLVSTMPRSDIQYYYVPKNQNIGYDKHHFSRPAYRSDNNFSSLVRAQSTAPNHHTHSTPISMISTTRRNVLSVGRRCRGVNIYHDRQGISWHLIGHLRVQDRRVAVWIWICVTGKCGGTLDVLKGTRGVWTVFGINIACNAIYQHHAASLVNYYL